jgi:hypothetical protein
VSAPRVVVAGGHMVDAPDRARPRFPADQVGRVGAAVRAALDGWGVDGSTTLITGGARGADLLAAEAAAERGARVRIVLALPADEFEARSVALRGTDWASRFRRALQAAEVEQPVDAPAGDVFAAANARMIDAARALDAEPHALVVWDGREGDGPGGTRDLVRRLGHTGPGERVRVVDPTRRVYEARQASDGPKKLLALDGGGIRGALSVEILRTLETRLRNRYGGDLVLADYFDYIGGTSTGAIIAAALALGKPVSEVARKYEALGPRIFKKRFRPLQLRSLYRDGPLTEELEDFFGAERTLGDPELRSLLLLVLHNSVTDSPWPLSNCTNARYNRADRSLLEAPDRNLDLPLVELIRGSTAAPVFFPPEELRVGRHPFVFQDGGVTPFNNPALMMFLAATLPEYGLGWPVGEDELLIASVGTGAAAAVHPGLLARKVHVGFQAKNLPGVFMNGASFGQDLLCRSLGRTRRGEAIDTEFGARLDVTGVAGRSLFTYLRYNADLSEEPAAVRKLDAVDSLPRLQELGRSVGASIDFERDFEGFLA